MNGSVQKLILVVKGSESGQTLERWVFDVECKFNKENERYAYRRVFFSAHDTCTYTTEFMEASYFIFLSCTYF